MKIYKIRIICTKISNKWKNSSLVEIFWFNATNIFHNEKENILPLKAKITSNSWSYIEPASNILATWVNFTISATWDNFTISAKWVTFTISATSSHSCCNLFNLNLFEWLYYHKIHILFGKNQDAFMNNLEVFFVYCTYFRFFSSVCGKCTFLNGKAL